MSCSIITFAIMSYIKNNIITINLNEWCTQSQKAIETDIKINTISQRIKRAKEGKPGSKGIEFLDIPELSITLVKR